MRTLALALAVALGLAPGAADAHPHGWIDMQSKLLFDEDGRVRAIRQAWLFDELYSAFMLDEIRLSGETREEGLARLAAEDMAALAEFDYFTEAKAAGRPLDFARVTDYANGVAEERIWLRFDLPLAEPVDPTASALRYAVYDPTYYIEILHMGDVPVQLEGPGSEACEPEIVEPEPSEEIIGFAAALDMMATAEEGLGRHFAQWIALRCDSR